MGRVAQAKRSELKLPETGSEPGGWSQSFPTCIGLEGSSRDKMSSRILECMLATMQTFLADAGGEAADLDASEETQCDESGETSVDSLNAVKDRGA